MLSFAVDISDTASHSSEDEDMECPLCMEEIDITDKYFKPCPCGYQICRFCWNHIKENLNGKCPGCRRDYSEDTVEFFPVSAEELQRIKGKKKKKERERKEQEVAARRHLANIRVIQKNLVYVLGLPAKICSEEILRSQDYFGQYGKITRIVVNRRGQAHTPSTTTATVGNGVYVTFQRKEDATKSIEAVDGSVYDGKIIRASYGTTKYCSFFLRNQNCLNPNCQYLHEAGEEADSHPKDDIRQFSENKAPKPPPFPIHNGKKDDKEESVLPPTANWAKQGKSIHPPVQGSAFNTTPNTTELELDPPVSRSKPDVVVKPKPTTTAPPGLYRTSTTNSTSSHISPTRNTGSSSQGSDFEHSASASTEDREPRLSPTSTNRSASPLRSPEQNHTEPEINHNRIEKDELVDSVAETLTHTLILSTYGLNLLPKYNGPFDPFDSDPLALLASHESAALRNVSPVARYNQLNNDTEVNKEDNGEKKSKFEKFFSGEEQEASYETESADSQRGKVPDLRNLFTNVNPNFNNNGLGLTGSHLGPTARQQPLLQQLQLGFSQGMRTNANAHFQPQARLTLQQQQELLQQQLLQQQAVMGRLQQQQLSQQQQYSALSVHQQNQQQFVGLPQEDLIGQFLRENQYKNTMLPGVQRVVGQDTANFRDPAIMLAKMSTNGANVGPAPGFESRGRLRVGLDQQPAEWNGNVQGGNFPNGMNSDLFNIMGLR
ncbi:transcriptional repressor general negative regulator of transcription subunit 4 [Nowakowskiella sp. JEL0407]|nr:transcriptional repressor general negative regulator of transcription subunit 4 [Nowakowskiella sp. JEL0407]